MRLRYTLPALADLASILDYIADRSPQGAARIHTRIRAVTDLLLRYPLAGAVTEDPHHSAHDDDAISISHLLRIDRR